MTGHPLTWTPSDMEGLLSQLQRDPEAMRARIMQDKEYCEARFIEEVRVWFFDGVSVFVKQPVNTGDLAWSHANVFGAMRPVWRGYYWIGRKLLQAIRVNGFSYILNPDELPELLHRKLVNAFGSDWRLTKDCPAAKASIEIGRGRLWRLHDNFDRILN